MSALTLPDYAALLNETLPSVIHSPAQYDEYARRLEDLVFAAHPSEADEKMIELLSLLIEDYDKKEYQIPAAAGREILQELISAHNLKQRDLVDVFGAESTVSAILRGKRQLTLQHIRGLARRFNVSPAIFFPDQEFSHAAATSGPRS